MIKELDYPSYANAGSFQRISWGAVFSGASVSLAVLVVLTALGAGVGLADGPVGWGIEFAGALWMLLSGSAAFFAGGWIAGRLTGIARVSESVIHGVVSWAAATLTLAFAFSSTTAGALGAVATVTGSTLGRPQALDLRMLGSSDVIAAMQASGPAGIFGFVLLLCCATASAYGARAGTRMLRPVPISELRRERAGV